MTVAAANIQTPETLNLLIVHQARRIASLESLVNQSLEVTDIFVDLWNDEGEPSPEALALFATRVRFLREDCRRAFI